MLITGGDSVSSNKILNPLLKINFTLLQKRVTYGI